MDILSTLNLFYEKNKDLILEIYNMNKCENCGGNFEVATCRYCGTTNKKLEETLLKFEKEISALSSLLDGKKINELPSNNFFNLIHLLKNKKIAYVDNILEKYNYNEKYQQLYSQALIKIQEDKELNQEELGVIEVEILNNEKDHMNIYNYYISNAILKKQNVSYETFKVLIKKFVESSMNTLYKGILNPVCEISTEMKDKNGESFFNFVRLNEEDVKELYYGTNFELIFTMAHEIKHAAQYRKIFIDKDLVMQLASVEEMVEDYKFMMTKIKEFAIFSYYKDYYYDNYNNISFEVEAEIYGIEETIRYLNSLNLSFSEDALNRWLTKIANFTKRKDIKERIFYGEVTTVDEVFEKVLKEHPEILNTYKQLNLFYKVVDGEVVAKTAEEQLKDLEMFMNNPNIKSDIKEFFQIIYQESLGVNRS